MTEPRPRGCATTIVRAPNIRTLPCGRGSVGTFGLFLIACAACFAQDQPAPPENWNIYYQATSIGQYHGEFHSPYQGPLSLNDYTERDVSLTTTLFFGYRPWRNAQFYFDPEIAGGKGFSNVDGVANATNGELPRVASATPKPYIARLYVTQDFGFGSKTEKVETWRTHSCVLHRHSCRCPPDAETSLGAAGKSACATSASSSPLVGRRPMLTPLPNALTLGLPRLVS